MHKTGIRALLCSVALFCGVLGLSGRAPAQEGKADPAREGSTAPTEASDKPLVQEAPAADPARIAAGRALYAKTGCAGCHGLSGQGGIGPMTGPRLGARPDLPLEAFAYLVRNPVTAMPPYSEKVLSDAEVADIHAYLLSAFQPGKIDEIPMLQNPR